MVTSVYSIGRMPAELSIVRATSARPSAGRVGVPAKMTSSMRPPRSDLAPCSPSTQAIASTTLDLPEPFGPTITVIPGSNSRVVFSANDLNPRRVSDLRNTRLARDLSSSSRRSGHSAPGPRQGWEARGDRYEGPPSPVRAQSSTANATGPSNLEDPGTTRPWLG